MEVIFFPNGNTACFINGEQVPELQESWIVLFIKHLEKNNYNPMDFVIKIPCGECKPFKTEEGLWNWDIIY